MSKIQGEVDNSKIGGGKLTKFGVWCNPTRIGERGDDYYYEFSTKKEARRFIATHEEADRMYFETEIAK